MALANKLKINGDVAKSKKVDFLICFLTPRNA